MNFDEWNKYNLGYTGREAYEAGAQSQQAKIGILQIKLNGADERAAAVLNHKNKMIDELQAKIDEALRFYNEAKSPHNIGMIQMAIYLKGNKDETELN